MAKEISELTIKDDVRYAEDHEWAKKEGGAVKIGISDYAQDQLGDIVFVELPEVDSDLKKGDEFGTVESTKAVSELYMPLGGKVVAINEALADDPEQVNKDPYGGGWMVEIEPSDPAEFEAMMDKDAYLEMLKGL
jgi:glycine cleavage system H protein